MKNKQNIHNRVLRVTLLLFLMIGIFSNAQIMLLSDPATSSSPNTPIGWPSGITIMGIPTGSACAGSLLTLSTSYTNVDSYAWSADNGATLGDPTSANPIITLPNTDVDVTVTVVLTRTDFTPSTITLTAVINVDAASITVNISGPICLDVEQTDYAPVADPLANRQATPDDFTNLSYTVGTATGGTSFSWSWITNPGNNGTINSGANTHTVDVSFAKTLAAAGGTSGGSETYVLQCEIKTTGQCTIYRTITITLQDKSCFCNTQVVDMVGGGAGRTWMDRNLGASRRATVDNDFLAYGCLFQWGRGNDGHADIDWTSSTAGTPVNGTTTTLATTDTPGHGNFIVSGGDWRSPQNDNLWQGLNGINNPCPTGYRIPTEAEYVAEIPQYNINSLAIVYGGGRRNTNGVLLGVASFGYYWTSTVNGANARVLLLGGTVSGYSTVSRSYGLSVRCIKD